MSNTDDMNWLDEILTNLGAYKITTFEPTTEEYYAYYPELKRAKQAIRQSLLKRLPKEKEDKFSVEPYEMAKMAENRAYNRCLADVIKIIGGKDD